MRAAGGGRQHCVYCTRSRVERVESWLGGGPGGGSGRSAHRDGAESHESRAPTEWVDCGLSAPPGAGKAEAGYSRIVLYCDRIADCVISCSTVSECVRRPQSRGFWCEVVPAAAETPMGHSRPVSALTLQWPNAAPPDGRSMPQSPNPRPDQWGAPAVGAASAGALAIVLGR